MKRQVLILLAAGAMSFMISGCAANQVSLVDEKMVSVKEKSSEKVKILWTDVYQQDGRIWAAGILEQQGLGTGAVKTHVDIQVWLRMGRCRMR
jgi:protein involved in sex pheromone biosynthesis